MIENDTLRAYVNNYIGLAVRRYEENQRRNRKPIKEKSEILRNDIIFEESIRKYFEPYEINELNDIKCDQEIQRKSFHGVKKRYGGVLNDSYFTADIVIFQMNKQQYTLLIYEMKAETEDHTNDIRFNEQECNRLVDSIVTED